MSSAGVQSTSTTPSPAMDRESKEVYEEYLSSLGDLNVNSKPLINMLTILAEENIERAAVIVQAVDHHIAKVASDVKLPILYLIDSIVKNVGREYKNLFSQCIVSLFCGVFEKVNEKTREKMYNLRTTWNDVFSQTKLYALDVKVNCIDPNWPITAKVVPNRSPAIHVNPNFFNRQSNAGVTDMQQQLRDKERELLELQKKKLELELAATKKRIEEQEKQLNLQTESVKPGGAETTASTKSSGRTGSASQTTMSVPTPPTISSVVTKPRINPVVNPALVSSMKSRDPRLLRQQQQQQQKDLETKQHLQRQQQQPPHMGNENMMRPNMPGRQMMGGRLQRPQPLLQPLIRPHINPNRLPLGSRIALMPPDRTTIQKLDKIPRLSSRVENGERRDGARTNDEQKKSSRDKNGSRSSSKSSGKSSSSSNNSRSPKHGSSRDKEKSREKDDKPETPESPSKKSDSSKKKSSSRSPSSRQKPTGSPSTATKLDVTLSPKKSGDHKVPAVPTLEPVEKSTESSDTMPPAAEPTSTKFKDMKATKGRNYSRRNRNPSKSPEPPMPPTAAEMAVKHDVDLRTLLPVVPEKKARLDAIIDDRIKDLNMAESIAIAMNVDMSEKKTIIEASAKDIDLRLLPPNPIESIKKRTSSDKSDEPNAKKSKSEKIDILFGSEDVDLRTLNANAMLAAGKSAAEILTAPPPPMISKTNDSVPKNTAAVGGSEKQKNSRLDEVRAKLAELKKDKLGRPLLYNKLPDDPVERKRRISTPSKPEVKKDKAPTPVSKDDDENSQESYTTNIKTIIVQAQEQLESKEIDNDQYETLVKQVLQINEKRQIVEMQRKEAQGNTNKRLQGLLGHSEDDVSSFSSENESRNAKKSDESRKMASKRTERGRKHNKREFDERGEGRMQGNDDQDRKHQMDQRRGGRDDHQQFGQWNQPWDRNSAIPSPPQAPNQSGHPWQQMPATVFDQNNFNRNSMLQTGSGNGLEKVLRQPINAPLTETKSADIMRSINIDGIPREIRFYEETAIIVMDFQDLREIGFQMGQRRVTVDDVITVFLDFNDNYKPVIIEGKTYQIRFGAPTRELYIDGHFYECYFGPTTAPLQVMLADGKMHKFDIEGPPPQVKIGNKRPDLVVGMCNMVVDAKILIPLFLDGTQQVFEIDGRTNILQFADFLMTVLINNVPHSVVFGGFPKSVRIQGEKHFIRFTALSKGLSAGKHFIKHMRRTERQRDMQTPPLDTSVVPMIPFIRKIQPIIEESLELPAPEQLVQPPIMAPVVEPLPLLPAQVTGFPLISQGPIPLFDQQQPTPNYQMTTEAPLPQVLVAPVVEAAAVVPAPVPVSVTNIPSIPVLNNLNIEEFYQKLVTSGILGKTIKTDETDEKKESSKRSKDKDKVTPVRLSKPESIKKRQSGIVTQLFSGMQCSSCGVRFPPEQTMRYSQHLDWHFRQNRRDRDSARRAHSRKWYYDVSDWIQYEEIEDLEEREKNWFETQQHEQMDVLGGEDSGQRPGDGESALQSCPAGPDGIDKNCHMCHDAFEHFYNEETEEWHLKSAIMVDDVFYHPLCYEDYKTSLTLDESAINANLTLSDNNTNDDDVVEVIGEPVKKEKVEKMEADDTINSIDDDDDDVIALPTEEPVVTEILDDEDEKAAAAAAAAVVTEEETAAKEPTEEEKEAATAELPDTDPDVMIKEPIIETHDVDEYVPKSLSTSISNDSIYQPGIIKIKEEPKDDGYEDDGFEDVGTFEASFVVKEPEDSLIDDDSQPIEVENVGSPTPVAPAHSVTTIDGNVDILEVAGPVVTSHKIRINITKSKQQTTLPSTTNINNNLDNKTDDTSILDNLTSTSQTTATKTTNNSDSKLVNEIIDVNIEYELKESLKNIDFKKIEPKRSGYETSGLCSVM